MNKTMLPTKLLPDFNQDFADYYILSLKESKEYTGCVFETARVIANKYNDDVDMSLLAQCVALGFIAKEAAA